jgi:hypothetical protein
MAGGRKGKPPVSYKDFEEGGAERVDPKIEVVSAPRRTGMSPPAAPAATSGNLYADLVNKMMKDSEKKSPVKDK